MNDLLICVPCRYHSTRLPGKPLLKINELSIINHVYLNILKLDLVVFVIYQMTIVKMEPIESLIILRKIK